MQKVFALRTAPFSRLEMTQVAELLARWGVDEEPADVGQPGRDSSAFSLTTSKGVHVMVRSEAEYKYPVLLLSGSDVEVNVLGRRMKSDVWSREELLIQATETDPPDASLLVPVALVTEVLDEPTVEILIRALEADSVEHRRQAITAISFVPALAFAPALLVHQRREKDARLQKMSQRVLAMCEA